MAPLRTGRRVRLPAAAVLGALLSLAAPNVGGHESAAAAVMTAARPALHMLVVGINKYEDSGWNLGYARQDATALAEFFQRPQGRNLFANVRATRLLDHDATKAAIQEALDQLADQGTPDDVAVVYLAGHGVRVGQQFYFLASEMRTADDLEAAYRTYGIPATALSDALRRMQATNRVLILDACNAGEALPILAKTVQAMQRFGQTTATYLIAASTSRQFAVEAPALGHGVLAYAVLRGLDQGIPAGPNRLVTIRSLLRYVEAEVPPLAARYHPGDTQTPVTVAVGSDFPLWAR